MTNIKYTNEFGLTVQELKAIAIEKPVVVPTNHIVVIDCSGSMSYDLPELRKQLKNKLPDLVKEKDTVSLIWFSGRNEFGILQEEIEVKSLKDLSKLNEAIDRFLQPIGLTGFKQPLEAVKEVVARIEKNRPNSVFSLFFMSDGYDNQWNRNEILAAAESLKPIIGTSVVVEHGWHADRDLLSKIAETIGGSLVFSQDFKEYDIQFSNAISKGGTAAKKNLVKLKEEPLLDYAFSWDNEGKITTYTINDRTVLVPENLSNISYFSVAKSSYTESYDTETYIGLITLSQRMNGREIFDILKAMGDVYLANKFTNSFSKQDYIDFQTEVLNQGLNASTRYRDGKDKNAVPDENAYTVLDILNDLATDEGNLIYPYKIAEDYARIGAGSVQRDKSVKFEYNDKNEGVPLDALIYHSSRPNVSLRVKRDGSVRLPDSLHFSLPDVFPTWIYRNYNIIRDGIVNTRKLPVSLTEDTISRLVGLGLFDKCEKPVPGEMYIFDVSSFPVVNRSMVKSVSAKYVFTKAVELEALKAAQKVFKYFREKYADKKSTGFAEQYGADATAWLKEIGITEGGFNPPSDTVEFKDFYVAKELLISVSGLSSLPKVEDAIEKMKSGKTLTLGVTVMAGPITRANEFLRSEIYQNASDQGSLLTAWLDGETKFAITRTRTLNAELSQIKASIILGHVWFNDLSAGENSLVLDDIDGIEQPVTVTAKLVDKGIGGKD